MENKPCLLSVSVATRDQKQLAV